MAIRLYLLLWMLVLEHALADAWKFQAARSTPLLDVLQDHLEVPNPRRLAAGAVRSDLKIRELDFHIKHEATFHFVDGAFIDSDSKLAARVMVKSDKPILVLEDVENDLVDVWCSDNVLRLSFRTTERFEHLREETDHLQDFVVVTSHSGCNVDHERTPHIVSNMAFNGHHKTATLQISSLTWQEAFHTISVDFGSSNPWPDVHLRDQNVLRKRQASNSAGSTNSTPTLTFPAPPTSSPSETSVSQSINGQLLNTIIMPPQIPVADLFEPQGATLSCKNCTLAGGLELSQGSFTISGSDNFDDEVKNTINFFEQGTLQLVAHNLFAHIELDTSLSVSLNALHFTSSLPAIPLMPFEIPGVAVLGPLVLPQIITTITLAEAIDFTYGFNLSVPDGSSFMINMTDLGSSTMKGFDRSTANAFPFRASDPVTSLIFSLSLSPQILLGISTPVGTATGGVGAFLDLPLVWVNVSQVSDVDEKCNAPSNPAEDGIDTAISKVLGNLTNIVPSVDLNVGAVAEFDVQVGDFHSKGATSVTIASTAFTLPTACLSFDHAHKTYGAPPLVETTSGVAVATSTKKTSAAATRPRQGNHWNCLLVILSIVICLTWA